MLQATVTTRGKDVYSSTSQEWLVNRLTAAYMDVVSSLNAVKARQEEDLILLIDRTL